MACLLPAKFSPFPHRRLRLCFGMQFDQFRRRLRAVLRRATRIAGLRHRSLSLVWHRRGSESWLQALPQRAFAPPPLGRMSTIEAIAESINRLGLQPLWEGYRAVYRNDPNVPFAQSSLARTPDQVRSQAEIGCLFAWMATMRRPQLIVEFGTAFGISAMYWAAGLDQAGTGRLLTFEPNEVWYSIAAKHLRDFSSRIDPIFGTFEEHIDDRMTPGEKIDIAFVDAIHTSTFVTAQVELLVARLAPGGIVVLDDISFSDDMRQCWTKLAADPRVSASVAVEDRVGILEFRSG